MVLMPEPRALPFGVEDELGLDRRDLHVARARHPRELRADPDRVADALERPDADREVELGVAEGPRLARAGVAHDPRVGR